MASFHAPVKTLNPVDIALPENVVKGAVLVDSQLSEWLPNLATSADSLASTFIIVDRKKEDVDDLTRRVANELRLPAGDFYGLVVDEPRRFITSGNLDRIPHGFMLTITASPEQCVRRIGEILKSGKDAKKMEWAMSKLDEFAQDEALVEVFYRISSIELLFELVRDDRVMMSSTLLSTCLRALSAMLELSVDGVGWDSMPREVVVAVASFVTGRAKSEDSSTLLAALHVIEQLANNESTRDVILEEVAIESLIRHLEKSDERISLAALSLMNTLLRCSTAEKHDEMIKTLNVVPFRTAVNGSLLRGGHSNLPDVTDQLVCVQRVLISAFDTSAPSEEEIEKIMNVETLDEVIDEQIEAWRSEVRDDSCGSLATGTISRFFEQNPQDVRMLVSENTMRTEGGKWQLIPLCLRCVRIVAELFGIVPGNDSVEDMIALLFSSDTTFDALFASTVHLFHRTWREMIATEVEIDKVSNVVGEQLRVVLRKKLADMTTVTRELEVLSYWKMQEMWRKEQVERENDQMVRKSVIDLGKKLTPSMEELIRANCRNHMKRGHRFRRNTKGKGLHKGAFWFWKLDSSEKMLTITSEGEKYTDDVGEISRQVWIKDIADVAQGDEVDRKMSSSRFTPTVATLRGIRVQLREGDVLSATTTDERVASMWLEGLTQLVGASRSNRVMGTMVDRMLNMELRVRLLFVDNLDETPPPPVPALPENIMSIVAPS